MVKDNQFKPTFKPESTNFPKTYEQFILEEKDLSQQDLYPELGYEDVGEQKVYGPCERLNCTHTFSLVIKIVGGTWWYYTYGNAHTFWDGGGGEHSWWEDVSWLGSTAGKDNSQQKTSAMFITNIKDARKTLSDLGNGNIWVVNASRFGSQSSNELRDETSRVLEKHINLFLAGNDVNESEKVTAVDGFMRNQHLFDVSYHK